MRWIATDRRRSRLKLGSRATPCDVIRWGLGWEAWVRRLHTRVGSYRRRCAAKRAVECAVTGTPLQLDPYFRLYGGHPKAAWRTDDCGSLYSDNEAVCADLARRGWAAVRRARRHGGRCEARAEMLLRGLQRSARRPKPRRHDVNRKRNSDELPF